MTLFHHCRISIMQCVILNKCIMLLTSMHDTILPIHYRNVECTLLPSRPVISMLNILENSSFPALSPTWAAGQWLPLFWPETKPLPTGGSWWGRPMQKRPNKHTLIGMQDTLLKLYLYNIINILFSIIWIFINSTDCWMLC